MWPDNKMSTPNELKVELKESKPAFTALMAASTLLRLVLKSFYSVVTGARYARLETQYTSTRRVRFQ
ncbi:hypothetical protein SAMN02745866_04009 [Alteromonadaceae bacterium Bs31]|nr:hypothetical protein SAMN02745866_04009 [Alteromonadaceae bacterium Bs31]